MNSVLKIPKPIFLKMQTSIKQVGTNVGQILV